MADEAKNQEINNSKDVEYTYIPDSEEQDAIQEVARTFEKARNVLNRSYSYFNGRSLFEAIDDWTKRWNGYIPPMNPLLDQTQSQIFVNFTRNAVISYLSKVAMSLIRANIRAVNKKTGVPDKQFADVLRDLNRYSLDAENAPAKFLSAGMEAAVKGTVVVYEGYSKQEQKQKIPVEFDATTGKINYKEDTRVIFDNCYQEIIPLEDFYITNPYQPEVQKQPKIIWRRLTTKDEGEAEFGGYKNWKYVKAGTYISSQDVSTFYRSNIMTDLGKDQIEILKYYCRADNRHVVMINGVILYDGPIPFKDGRYPFAHAVNEPFAVDFFWGSGHPNKYMGEQDLINTFINMMADKTFNSLTPTGLSSDLDDLIDDDVMQVGKIRKVSDISKWEWWNAPDVTSGEQNMLSQILSLAHESANIDTGNQYSPKGGKLSARQLLQKQQEMQQKLSFNMNFLEDLERDRTMLRLNHIMQFYSIPKIEKITGKRGKEIQQLVYRDIRLMDTELSDGRKGARVIHLIGDEHKNPDDLKKLQDKLSVDEMMGEEKGVPTEALAISVDTFGDYNFEIEVVKNSSFERNQTLDQASRLEFANWRIPLAQVAPCDIPEVIKWVEESFDVDSDRFEKPAQQPNQLQQGQGMPPQGSNQPQGASKPLQAMKPTNMNQSVMNQ